MSPDKCFFGELWENGGLEQETFHSRSHGISDNLQPLLTHLRAYSSFIHVWMHFWILIKGESHALQKKNLLKVTARGWSIWDQTPCIAIRCGLWWGSGGALRHSNGAGRSRWCRLKLTLWGWLKGIYLDCLHWDQVLLRGREEVLCKTNLEEVGDRVGAACVHHGASEQIWKGLNFPHI